MYTKYTNENAEWWKAGQYLFRKSYIQYNQTSSLDKDF